MLRINQQRSSAAAKSYFDDGLAREDYYTKDSIPGEWGGVGARHLGLEGQVPREHFANLCDNLHPTLRTPLTARTRADRTVGYDFNWHAPKSLSLLHSLTDDARLLDAFRAAVRETMRQLEAEAKTRVRAGGQNAERTTGNLVWAEFVHQTARPVGGVPDPHLHAHCVVFNATFDGQEAKWKAAQFRDLKRDAPYWEACFHARLSKAVADLGYGVVRTRTGWEVAGFEKDTLDKFSRRTAHIEQLAREQGVTTPDAKAELGAKTRERKGEPKAMNELRAEWAARLTPRERIALAGVRSGRGELPPPITPEAAVDHALADGFERASVVPERRLLASALKRGYGSASLSAVEREFASRHEVIRQQVEGQSLVTTRAVLAEEAAALHFARSSRGSSSPLGRAEQADQFPHLGRDQREAVRHVLTSTDRVLLIRGAAGTGKTSLLTAARDALREQGKAVYVFAPTSEAARGVLCREGFDTADTVARLLTDPKAQERVRGQVLWIDEAGQLGAKDMTRLFRVAEEQNARVVLMGDERQHGAVARGDAFRLLQTHAGLQPAEVGDIRRQRGEYKRAVESIAAGDLGGGFARLDALGAIREVPDESRHTTLAHDYLQAVEQGKSALVVAPTHREGRLVTAEIRGGLKAAGRLTGPERVVPQLQAYGLTEAMRADAVNYQPGDVVRFHQNARGGFHKGDAAVVTGVSDTGEVLVRLGKQQPKPLPLDQAKHFDLYERRDLPLAVGDRLRVTANGMAADGKTRLLNGSLHTVAGFTRGGGVKLDSGAVLPAHFGHVAHGYCTTSHASQGKTVDRVFVAVGPESFPAASREQFYVSVSRGREEVTVYCQDKGELLDAVGRSSHRPTATELTESKPPAPQQAETTPARERHLRHAEHTRRLRRAEDRRRSPEVRDSGRERATVGHEPEPKRNRGPRR